MARDILYIALGYMCGSILFARLFGALIKTDVTRNAPDGNPGAANAFKNGGFWCGALTLCGDILKGALPVHLYLAGEVSTALALVLAAPVIGHVFPLFYGFKGGKGIACTFGCLLGLFPMVEPLLALALFFIFFSVILRITPTYHRTLVTYLCAELTIVFLLKMPVIAVGFTLISLAVGYRMLKSPEEKARCRVGVLWMH